MFRSVSLWLVAGAVLCSPCAAAAQTTLDRVDPARVEERTPAEPRPVNPAAPVEADARAARSLASRSVTVGAIVPRGLRVLRPADFADVIERYVGRTLSPADLAALADALAERARERGFLFATATIAPQPVLAGVLTVDLDEGAVDEIRLSGAENGAVRAALQPLAGAGPVTRAQVERRLLVAGDVDGVWIRRTRFLREGARNVLAVEIGTDSVTGLIGLANDGSRPIGPIQADAYIKASQLLADDDLLTLSAVTTPFEPEEFAYGRVRYAKRLGADGTELSGSLSYSTTHPGAYLESRDIDGRSWSAIVSLFRPMWRRREESLWLDGSLGVRTVKQDREGELARRDRLTVARLRATGYRALLGGRLRAAATVSRGLDLLDATGKRDRLASRRDADGVFTSFHLHASWLGPLAPRVTLEVAAASQIATEPLLVSEEVGLGGGTFLRGYDYSERSGDNGAMASGELRYDLAGGIGPVRKPQLYAFADGGRVTNLEDGFGTGTLVSTGAGLRAGLGELFTADLGLAVPLSGARYDSGNSDPVLNFRLTKRL